MLLGAVLVVAGIYLYRIGRTFIREARELQVDALDLRYGGDVEPFRIGRN